MNKWIYFLGKNNTHTIFKWKKKRLSCFSHFRKVGFEVEVSSILCFSLIFFSFLDIETFSIDKAKNKLKKKEGKKSTKTTEELHKESDPEHRWNFHNSGTVRKNVVIWKPHIAQGLWIERPKYLICLQEQKLPQICPKRRSRNRKYGRASRDLLTSKKEPPNFWCLNIGTPSYQHFSTFEGSRSWNCICVLTHLVFCSSSFVSPCLLFKD